MTRELLGSPRPLLVALLVAIGGVSSATAQRLVPSSWSGVSQPRRARPDRPVSSPHRAPSGGGTMILGGLIGGTAGFFAGALIGGAAGGGNRLCGDDPCGLEGALWGAGAGVSLGVPLGVHVANHGRGRLAEALLASVAAAGFGLVAAHATDNGLPLLFVPVAQLSLSLAIEGRASSP